MLAQASHAARLEQIRTVFDMAAKPLWAVPDIYGDIEDSHSAVEIDSRPATRTDTTDVKLAREKLEAHLKQRISSEIPLWLQFFDELFEEQVLVGVGVERPLPDTPEQLSEGGITTKPGFPRWTDVLPVPYAEFDSLLRMLGHHR